MKRKTKPKSKWRLIAILVLLLVVFGLIHTDEFGLTIFDHARDTLTENDWVGWVHPLGDGVGRVIKLGPYNSLSECENKSWTHMNEQYEGWEDAVYYCGYSCTDTAHDRREEACKLVR